jgi:hypothetical protein
MYGLNQRADMIQQAQDQVKHTSDESEQEINVQKIIDKHTKELSFTQSL